MSSGGGGKGGGKKTTTETTVPEWIRAPAERNLQRAEALQQIEYMPYYGAEVAAFNPNQEMAFQNNANTAAAFGLLAPTDAMAGMPTPTTYDNGMTGYSSIPIYDQAKKDLAANYGDTVDAYDALFGNAVPALVAQQTPGGGGGGGGSISVGANPQPDILMASGSPNGRGTPGGRNRGSGVLAGKTNPVYRRNVVADRAKTSQRNYNTYGKGKQFSGDY
jgi:hypothetical protein